MKRESRNILGSLSWENRQTEMSILSALNFNSGIVNKTNKYISLTRPSSILTQSVQPSETQEVLYIYIYSHSVCVQISCKHCYNTLGVDEIVIITLQINDLITIVKIVVFFPNGKDD